MSHFVHRIECFCYHAGAVFTIKFNYFQKILLKVNQITIIFLKYQLNLADLEGNEILGPYYGTKGGILPENMFGVRFVSVFIFLFSSFFFSRFIVDIV